MIAFDDFIIVEIVQKVKDFVKIFYTQNFRTLFSTVVKSLHAGGGKR